MIHNTSGLLSIVPIVLVQCSSVTQNAVETISVQLLEVTRLIYDLMEYTETYQIPGLHLLIDFEKAFDSVDLKYILNILNFYHFGPDLILP